MPQLVFLNRIIYAAVPLLGLALAAGVAHETLLRGDVVNELRKSYALCSVPARSRLATDLTRGLIPPIDNAICVIHPSLRHAVSSETVLGLQAGLFSMILPILYRLNHLSISPNYGLPIFSGMLPLLALLLSLVLGPGIVAAGFVVPIYALGMLTQLRNRTSALTPLPVPASSAYTNNLSTVSLGLLVVLTYLTDPINQRALSAGSAGSVRSNFLLVSMLLCLWPAYQAIMLPLAAFSKNAPSSEADARKQLRAIDGDTLSYGFERIWGYYRRLALLSFGLYWFALIRVFRLAYALFRDPSTLEALLGQNRTALSTLERSYVLQGVALYFASLALLLLERLTIRTVQPTSLATSAKPGAPSVAPARDARHPLTGEPNEALDVECLRAISAAPAGAPVFELGWGTLACALVGGPGFAAMLWWSRGEEEMGWKARKAWRSTVATEGKIQAK